MKYDIEELLKENMNLQGTPSRELNERILYHDRGGNGMQNKKFVKYMPKVAAAALAAVVVTGGIGYAAVNLWDRSVAEDFGVAKDPEMMREMNDKGFAQQPQETGAQSDRISATDKGITVTLKQTLADEHSAYVCYEVKYGDRYKAVDQEGIEKHPDYGIAMPWTDFQMDSGIPLNYSGGVKKVIDDHTVLYEDFITTSKGEDTLDKGKMKMSLSNFAIDRQKADPEPEVIAKDGNWNLSWDLSVGTEKRIYHLDRTLKLGKERVVLKDLTVSPLSYTLTIGSEGTSLNDVFAVVKESGDAEVALDKNGDMKVIRYVRTNEENADQVMEKLPKGQMLCSLDSIALCLDGKDFDGEGGMGSVGRNHVYGQFDKVLNLEKLTGARIAGKHIDLKSVPYDTEK